MMTYIYILCMECKSYVIISPGYFKEHSTNILSKLIMYHVSSFGFNMVETDVCSWDARAHEDLHGSGF